MHNLAKRHLAQLIKEECWNSMAVKGRALKVMGRTPAITSLLMRIFIERSHGRKCLQRTFVILRKFIYRKAFKSCCAFPVLSPCYVIFSCLILPSMLSTPVLPSRHLLRSVSAPLPLFLLRHYLHPGLTMSIPKGTSLPFLRLKTTHKIVHISTCTCLHILQRVVFH